MKVPFVIFTKKTAHFDAKENRFCYCLSFRASSDFDLHISRDFYHTFVGSKVLRGTHSPL